MSKVSKNIIVIALIVIFLFAVSMFLASFVFVPTVTLDYGYPRINWNFDGRAPTQDNNIKEYQSVVRFSHYQAPSSTREGYTFSGWYRDEGYTVAWINGQDTVARDITLYAKWE